MRAPVSPLSQTIECQLVFVDYLVQSLFVDQTRNIVKLCSIRQYVLGGAR